MLIYASIQYDQINKAIEALSAKGWVKEGIPIWPDIQPYLVTVPCIIGFFTVVMSVIAWKLYDEFAWTIYKHISADLRMKRRFLTFQVSIRMAFEDLQLTANRFISRSSSSISSSSLASQSSSSSSSQGWQMLNSVSQLPLSRSRFLSSSWPLSGLDERTRSEWLRSSSSTSAPWHTSSSSLQECISQVAKMITYQYGRV